PPVRGVGDDGDVVLDDPYVVVVDLRTGGAGRRLGEERHGTAANEVVVMYVMPTRRAIDTASMIAYHRLERRSAARAAIGKAANSMRGRWPTAFDPNGMSKAIAVYAFTASGQRARHSSTSATAATTSPTVAMRSFSRPDANDRGNEVNMPTKCFAIGTPNAKWSCHINRSDWNHAVMCPVCTHRNTKKAPTPEAASTGAVSTDQSRRSRSSTNATTAHARRMAIAFGRVAVASAAATPASHHRRSSRNSRLAAIAAIINVSAYAIDSTKAPGKNTNSAMARFALSRPTRRTHSIHTSTVARAPNTNDSTSADVSVDSPVTADRPRMHAGNSGKNATSERCWRYCAGPG